MADQSFNYNTKKALTKNAFVIPGYDFVCWEWTQEDDTIVQFQDGQEVEKLTPKNSNVISLKAQWEACTHVEKPEESKVWTYHADGNVITGKCYCGYTETLTLEAQSTTYDAKAHPASLVYSVDEGYCPACFERSTTDGVTTVAKKPLNIDYTAEKIANNTINPTIPDNGPTYAGQYTASITAGTEAQIVYRIEKAEHPVDPAVKPKYTVDSGNKNMLLVENTGEVGTKDFATGSLVSQVKAPAEYRLVYYDSDKWVQGTEWATYPTDGKLTLEAKAEWKNYRVEVRFAETYNYLPSDSLQSDGTYFFQGGVNVVIICEDHISAVFETVCETQAFNTAKLLMRVEDGYFLVDNAFEVKVTVESTINGTTSSTTNTPEKISANGGKADYSMTKIVLNEAATNTTVTIEIGTAQEKASVTAAARERKFYSNMADEDAEVSISKDSAFTAYFKVASYNTTAKTNSVDAEATHVYESPVLSFQTTGETPTAMELPVGTTILLMDLSGGNKTYWHYKVSENEVSGIELKAFDKMGAAQDTDGNKHPGAQAEQSTLKYQFIVDFSQCADYPNAEFTMTLSVAKKEAFKADTYEYIPAPSGKVTVHIAETTFAMTQDTTSGLTRGLTLTYTPGHNAASRWDNRGSALKLTAQFQDLPEDLHFEVRSGNTFFNCFPAEDGVFWIPMLSELEAAKTVSLTLISAQFPSNAANYEFKAEWYVSRSAASKAPAEGHIVYTIDSVAFYKPADTGVSLKIYEGPRIVETGKDFAVHVEVDGIDKNIHKVDTMLQAKTDDGSYADTGSRPVLYKNTDGTIGDGAMMVTVLPEPGSYRVKITVTYEHAPGIVLDDIFYYFIAEAPKSAESAPTA